METNTRFIPTVIERTVCNRHGLSPGGPCYSVERSNGELLLGVCGKRIKEAGMVGRISAQSLSVKGRTHHAKRS